MKKLLIPATIMLAAFLISAQAHDTWLIPDRFEVASKVVITLDLTSGMAFPKLETGPKRGRVQNAPCRLAGRTFEMTDISAGPNSIRLKLELPEAGIATFWVKLPPKSIELKEGQVQEYLDEIDPPARMALEIVPEKDPTTLHEGDELVVRVLKNGGPYPEFSLNAVAAGETKGDTRKTDSAGRVTFLLNKQGPWLLRGTDVRKSTQTGADWESDFATLTLEVKPKPSAE